MCKEDAIDNSMMHFGEHIERKQGYNNFMIENFQIRITNNGLSNYFGGQFDKRMMDDITKIV